MTASNNVCLITGGTGLVGSAIKETINKKEVDTKFKFIYLSSKDADLRKFDSSRSVFDLYKPTHVINLAARVGGLFANMADNNSFYEDNIAINQNVLKCAAQNNIKKCISCLSTCIFPDKTSYPIDESMIHLGPPSETNYGYSNAKRQVDLLNKQYSKNKISTFTSVIPTNVYGKYDNFNIGNAHVIPALIHKAYISLKNHEPCLQVCGSGRPLRQFIYAPDLAKLIIWTLETYDEIEPLILSNDVDSEISIRQVAECVVDAFKLKTGRDIFLKFNEELADGQYKKTASNRKLRNYLPDFKFTSIQDGINDTVDWFCDNYYRARVGFTNLN